MSGNGHNGHIEVEDLAMFALLLLPAEEAELVRAHLRVCPVCSEELHHVREDLATYALAVEPMELPPGARERFLDAMTDSIPSSTAGSANAAPAWNSSNRTPVLTPESARGPALVPSPAKPRNRSGLRGALPFLGWAGWAVAAAVGLVAFGLRQDRNSLQAALNTQNAQTAGLEAEAAKARQLVSALLGPAAVRVNLSTPKAPVLPSARATYDPGSGTLLLVAGSLAPLPADKVYELWLIPADGTPPVPAGTFSPDGRGNASVLLPPLGGAHVAKAFGITVERAGGSPTPTLPILLSGSAS